MISDQKLNPIDAEAYCSEHNYGHLTSIETKLEYEMLQFHVANTLVGSTCHERKKCFWAVGAYYSNIYDTHIWTNRKGKKTGDS